MHISSLNYGEWLEGLRQERAEIGAEVERLSKRVAYLDQAITAITVLSDTPTPQVVNNKPEPRTEEQPEPAGRFQTMKVPLWEQIRRVFPKDQPMAFASIGPALKAIGIELDSPTPNSMIHSALARHPETFVRVRRGVWMLAADLPPGQRPDPFDPADDEGGEDEVDPTVPRF